MIIGGIKFAHSSFPPVRDNLLTKVDPTRRETLMVDRIKRSPLVDPGAMMSYASRRDKCLSFCRKYGSDVDVADAKAFSALASKPFSHLPLDETGSFSISGWTAPFSDEVIAAATSFYKKHAVTENPSLTIPRGHNLGYPFFTPGSDRKANDLMLACYVRYVLDRIDRGYNLKQTLAELQPIFGDAYNQQGFRRQHSGKDIPFYMGGSVYSSPSLEGKVRAILYGSKVSLIFNRQASKKMLKTILKTSVHTQDRDAISSQISKMYSSGLNFFATDQSKFDRHSGGGKALSAYRIISSVTGCDYDDLTEEFLTPSRIFGSSGSYLLKGGGIMPSGISTTTVINCCIAFCAALTVISDIYRISASEAVAQLGNTWHLLCWGDDQLLASSATIKQVSESYKKIGFEATDEGAIRYLGTLYERSNIKGRNLYSSLIRNSIEPERPKDRGALLQLGLAGRKTRMPSDVWSAYVRDFGLDVLRFQVDDFKVDFNCSAERVIAAGRWVEQHISDVINEMDDILYSLSSGNDGATFSSLLGVDMSDLDEFLGRYTTVESLMADTRADDFDPNTFLDTSSLAAYFSKKNVKYPNP